MGGVANEDAEDLAIEESEDMIDRFLEIIQKHQEAQNAKKEDSYAAELSKRIEDKHVEAKELLNNE